MEKVYEPFRFTLAVTFFLGLLSVALSLFAQTSTEDKKLLWKPVEFAIVKLNDKPPISWNMYHTEKKGVLLLQLWKRYLLVDMKEEEAYDIDPQTIKQAGSNVHWSSTDKPAQPIETPDWKSRNVGQMQRIQFRLGKDGHILELQIPLLVNGKSAY
jgi:hypothetical protein